MGYQFRQSILSVFFFSSSPRSFAAEIERKRMKMSLLFFFFFFFFTYPIELKSGLLKLRANRAG